MDSIVAIIEFSCSLSFFPPAVATNTNKNDTTDNASNNDAGCGRTLLLFMKIICLDMRFNALCSCLVIIAISFGAVSIPVSSFVVFANIPSAISFVPSALLSIGWGFALRFSLVSGFVTESFITVSEGWMFEANFLRAVSTIPVTFVGIICWFTP